jgi:hypothetical protein
VPTVGTGSAGLGDLADARSAPAPHAEAAP